MRSGYPFTVINGLDFFSGGDYNADGSTNDRPDLVGSGIKEKYPVQKMGIPFRQVHSWDYSGPYHGYDGFAIFARDMDMAINSPVWGLFDAPWKKKKEAGAEVKAA